MLQYDTGLRKIYVGHAFAALRYYMVEVRKLVREDGMDRKKQHLPENSGSYKQPDNSEYLGGTYRYGFACPGHRTRPVRGPTLILVPAGVLPRCQEHLSHHIDTSPADGISQALKIWEVSKAKTD